MAHKKYKTEEEKQAAVRENQRRYCELQRERRAESLRRYNETHREQVASAKRAWFDANPSYLRQYYEKNRERYLWKQAARRANELGLAFTISLSDIVIPDVCPVLGITIRRVACGGFNDHSPSLDRIVPDLGYVPSNVAVISWRANRLKGNATAAELKLIADWVAGETVRIEAEHQAQVSDAGRSARRACA